MSRIRLDVVPAVIVTAMAFVAALGFQGVFSDWSFLPAAAIGAIGASLAALGGRLLRLTVPESLLASLALFAVLGPVAAEGVPTPDAFATFLDGLVNGWAQVLSSSPPADLTAEFRVLPYTIAWIGAMVGGEVLRSDRTPGLAAIGPISALAFSLLITLEDRTVALAQGVAMVAGSLLLGFVQQRRRTEREALSDDRTVDPARRVGGSVAALVVVALVAVLAPLLGPRLPLASANERFDLREFQVPPFDPLEEPTPLVQIKAALQDANADRVVFTVRSPDRPDRFPLAVLDHYNSEFWAVADEAADAAGEFRPVDTVFPPPADGTVQDWAPVATTIEIVDLDQLAAGDFDPVWMPLPGWPVSVESDADLDLRFNADTGTLALPPDGPGPGLVYEVDAVVPPPVERLDLRGAEVERRPPLDLAAPQLRSFAGDVLEGADVGWEQVEAIRSALVDRGFYDSRENSQTGRSGHRLARLAEFVDDPDRIVGFEEQYAATAGLLAGSVGLPARVVVGYLIDDEDIASRWDGDRLDVVADDMGAWIEVRFEGIGWIPFDVTPPRDREPEETQEGRSQREVAVPNPPPDPPPPVLPPELDRDTDVEEEEEEDESEEEVATGGGIPVGAIAVGVGVSVPVIAVLGGALLVVALKRRRTDRRRNAPTPSRRVAGAWWEVVDRYSELGAKPRTNATTTEFARGLEAAHLIEPDDGAMLLALAHDADHAAYHPSPADDHAARSAWSKSDELVERIARRQGRWARVRHRIDPRPLLRRDPLIEPDSDPSEQHRPSPRHDDLVSAGARSAKMDDTMGDRDE